MTIHIACQLVHLLIGRECVRLSHYNDGKEHSRALEQSDQVHTAPWTQSQFPKMAYTIKHSSVKLMNAWLPELTNKFLKHATTNWYGLMRT